MHTDAEVSSQEDSMARIVIIKAEFYILKDNQGKSNSTFNIQL